MVMLNSLYGLFGRSQTNIKPYYVQADKYITALGSQEIIAEININSKLSLLLIDTDKASSIANKLRGEIEIDSSDFNLPTKSNVAIAAAVTSYARIQMIPLLMDDSVMYSDTDSIFTTKPIPANLIGPELGQLKDEMAGMIIDEAYFLGQKQYGYTYTDPEGNRVDKSVWAGVPRDTLDFRDITALAKGQVLHKLSKDRFFRTLSDLKIDVKDINLSLSRTVISKDNQYSPPHVTT